MELFRSALTWILGVAVTMSPALANPERQTRCSTAAAAAYHRVHHQVLAAIIMEESRGDPLAVNRNTNGSVDVGLAGTNSVHFEDLAAQGIAPADLLDGCVSRYVAAARLRTMIDRYPGRLWYAIGAYHSTTPYFNHRYQVRIWNHLVAAGAVRGAVLPVPVMLASPPSPTPPQAATATTPEFPTRPPKAGPTHKGDQ